MGKKKSTPAADTKQRKPRHQSGGPLKIVVPSHRRADMLTTHKHIGIDCVCIAESQLDAYREHNPDVEFVCHPDDVIGLHAKRQWMADHFGNLFMFDDDVSRVTRVWPGLIRMAAGEVAPDEVRPIVENLYRMAIDCGAYLFGFGGISSPIQYSPFMPFRFSGPVIGAAYGVRANSGLWWNPRMNSKEDVWVSCLNAVKHRICVVDQRYFTQTHECYTRVGGLTGQRTEANEEMDVRRLQYIFGEEWFTRRTVNPDGKGAHGKDTVRSHSSIMFKPPF